MSLIVKPLSLAEANRFIIEHHRHHGKVQGHKFSIGCIEDGNLVGVACVGRPVARGADDGQTLEVTRLCTDGSRNVCSFLYSRCARIAKEMGYRKIITYILEEENGASLRASSWTVDQKETKGHTWDTPSRRREVVEVNLFGEKVKYPTSNKQRWKKDL